MRTREDRRGPEPSVKRRSFCAVFTARLAKKKNTKRMSPPRVPGPTQIKGPPKTTTALCEVLNNDVYFWASMGSLTHQRVGAPKGSSSQGCGGAGLVLVA